MNISGENAVNDWPASARNAPSIINSRFFIDLPHFPDTVLENWVTGVGGANDVAVL
jgi:hypothetical protein